jgi:hypothetical protein
MVKQSGATTLSKTTFSIMSLSLIINKMLHSSKTTLCKKQSIVMLSVTNAQCHLCSVSFTSPFALSVVVLSVIMLNVVMLNVVMLNVVVLSVVAPTV